MYFVPGLTQQPCVFVSVCVCVCVSVCVCVLMFQDLYVSSYRHIHICTCVFARVCVYMYIQESLQGPVESHAGFTSSGLTGNIDSHSYKLLKNLLIPDLQVLSETEVLIWGPGLEQPPSA